ncbi:MAG: hypothetical protein P4M11_06440 [Candidatus Pacebacteria bacterium]|nr:hypothetical protein [Candidatus Paceibacterota bacterium]
MAKLSPEERAHYKERVGDVTYFLLMSATVSSWAVGQVIPSLTVFLEPISVFVGLAGTFLFGLWLFMLGVYDTKKSPGYKLGVTIIAAVIEALPFIDDIPADVGEVIALVEVSRSEDRKLAESKAAAAAKAAQEQQIQAVNYYNYMSQRALEEQAQTEAANEELADELEYDEAA